MSEFLQDVHLSAVSIQEAQLELQFSHSLLSLSLKVPSGQNKDLHCPSKTTSSPFLQDVHWVSDEQLEHLSGQNLQVSDVLSR